MKKHELPFAVTVRSCNLAPAGLGYVQVWDSRDLNCLQTLTHPHDCHLLASVHGNGWLCVAGKRMHLYPPGSAAGD